ncbi:hypothetical protein J5X84_35315 [Streptosporangiaceae bacterium NEAU-GS5]|nr:hypothetical protein [Streptosporangiaceae bacterium NEAU-GS5]
MRTSVRRVAAGLFAAVLAAGLTVGVPTAATAGTVAHGPTCGSMSLDA